MRYGNLECVTLAMVAKAVSLNYNVDVDISGSNAMTYKKQDPNTGKESYSITIPTVDVLDKQHMRMVRGYLDHEAGHVRFTDFDYLESLRDDPEYVMSFVNIAEDIFVEREMGKRYVGCEKNLRWLSKHLFTENYSKPNLVQLRKLRNDLELHFQMFVTYTMNYILYYMRAKLVAELSPFISSEQQAVECLAPGLTKNLVPIMEKWFPILASTHDSCQFGREMYEAIKQYIKRPYAGHDPADSHSFKKSIQDKVKNYANTPKQIAEEMKDMLEEAAEFSFRKCADGWQQSSYTDIGKSAGIELRAMHDKFIGMFEGKSNRTFIAHSVPPLSLFAKGDQMPPKFVTKAMSITAQLDAQLSGLMQSIVLNRGGHTSRGKLDPRKVYRLNVNNPRVFYRKEERLKFNAQVVILADCSGSMQGQREEMASISTYALARSLRKIPGIRTDVYYYSAVTFERALSQSDHISRFSRMQASGGTPTGSAVENALSFFNYWDDSRKIILLVTDGEAQDMEYLRYVLQVAARNNVEVFGVGIDCGAIEEVSEQIKDCKVIKHIRELPAAMFAMLRKALVR
jgi:uncharacterized protein YegL